MAFWERILFAVPYFPLPHPGPTQKLDTQIKCETCVCVRLEKWIISKLAPLHIHNINPYHKIGIKCLIRLCSWMKNANANLFIWNYANDLHINYGFLLLVHPFRNGCGGCVRPTSADASNKGAQFHIIWHTQTFKHLTKTANWTNGN